MTGAVCQAEPIGRRVVRRGRRRDVLGDLEVRARRVSCAVVRRDVLGAEQVVEVVRRLVRGDRVLDAAREDDLLDARDRIRRRGLDVVRARLVRVHEDLGPDHVRIWARLDERECGSGRSAEIHLDDGGGCVDGLVADAVGDAEPVLGAQAGTDGVGARHRAPSAREGVAGAVGEAGSAPLEDSRGGSDAGERVRACIDGDRDRAVGVVAVRIVDRAAGRLGCVRRDRERARGREAGPVEGRHSLGAREIAEAV